MEAHHLSDDSTYYEYTLVKKIHNHLIIVYGYFIIWMVPLLILSMKAYSITGIFVLGGVVVFIQIFHSFLLFILLRVPLKTRTSDWSFRVVLPWIGYLPKQFIPFSLITRVHTHLLWVGLVVIAGGIPWLSPSVIAILGVMHIGVLLPRLFIFYLLGGQHREGLVKINPRDTSYYIP